MKSEIVANLYENTAYLNSYLYNMQSPPCLWCGLNWFLFVFVECGCSGQHRGDRSHMSLQPSPT